MLTWKTGVNSEYVTTYLMPTMFFVAGAVFTLLTRRRPFGIPQWAADLSLGAYLCHGLVNEAVVTMIGRGNLAENPLWMLPATGLVAVGSFGLAYLLRKLPVLGKLLG
jgi:peptidoglycan/LPS O-acetylase OafA/YrhL